MVSDTLRTATAAEKSQVAGAIVAAIVEQGVARIDDAHRRYELPEGVEPRVWGGQTIRLITMGIIMVVGSVHTARDAANGRAVRWLAATDMGRARQYLASLGPAGNPPPTDRQMRLPGLDEPTGGAT